MPALPRVLSPIRPLFERDGIEIALTSVELWPDHLVVRLAALPNETTAAHQRLRVTSRDRETAAVVVDLAPS